MTQDETAINWEPYQDMIWARYVEQNHTLEDTRVYMETVGLKATIRQYKQRFSGYKNLKADEWIAVTEEVRNRAMRGIDSEVRLYGRLIDRERVKREVQRYAIKTRTKGSRRRVVIGRNNQDRITITTPQRRSPSPSTFPAVSVPVDTSEDLLLDLAFGGDINVNTENDIGDLAVIATEATPSLEVFTRIGEGANGDIFEDIGFHNPDNIVVLPSAELLDLGRVCVDGIDDWTMKIKLPCFELRELLEFQDLVQSMSSPGEMPSPGLWRLPTSLSPDIHSRHRAVRDLAVTERHRLLGEFLGHFPDGQVSDLVSSFTSYLSPRVPEIFKGDLATRMQIFFEPSHKRPLRDLFELTAFFASNNMLTKAQIVNFLKLVIDQNHTPQLHSFLRINTATTRVFSQWILKAAVSMQNTDLLRSLLLSGVDFQHVTREAIQIDDSDFVELLLSRVNAECMSGDSGGRLLDAISGTDNVRVASILVENGANIEFKSDDRGVLFCTPLYHAVYRGKLEMVRFLLKKGAYVNTHSSYSSAPTPIAAALLYKPNTEIITLLLEHGADIKCSVYNKDLLEYAFLEYSNIYWLILKKTGMKGDSVTVGEIVSAARKGSRTLSNYLAHHLGKVSQKQLEQALYKLIDFTHFDIEATFVLLDRGIDPNGLTLHEPPLFRATTIDGDQGLHVSQLLIGKGASVNVPGLLCRVVEESNFNLLCMLLDVGADLNEFGPATLENAVLFEECEAVALLLDKGVEINAVGDKFSPIQAAASLETLDLVWYLLGRGADVNTPAWGHAGRTALQAACASGNFDMVVLLLEKGADVNAAPAVSDGVTVLEGVMRSYAKAAVKAKLFKLLLAKGAEFPCPNRRRSKSVIHTIVDVGLMDLLEISLNAGADANQMSLGKGGRTPLQLAAELGRLDIAKFLIDHGALINAPPAYQHGRTALQAAASSSSPNMELLQFLVDKGADINAAAGVCGGITALQGAAIAGSLPVVQYLRDKGADVNSRPAITEGRTAIEGAAEHGRLDTVPLLLEYGAKGDVVRKKGYTRAIDLAKRNGHFDVANLLRSAQRDMELTLEKGEVEV